MAPTTKTQPIPEPDNRPPVIIYDGGCAFCRHWIAWFDPRLASSAQPNPSTDATLAIYGVSRADANASVQWVAGTDRASGARAVAAWLKSSGKRRWRVLGRIIAARPIAPIFEAAYRFVARNRHRLPTSAN